MLLDIKFGVERLLQKRPWLRHRIRELLPYFPFLLPHNQSFYGFRHLATSPNGLFLDVGANDGISALGFHKINSTYRILSIEPNPLHERALKSVKRKIRTFDYLIAGAGRQRGQLNLVVPHYKQFTLHTAASFQPDYLKQSFDREYTSEIRQAIRFSEHTVDVIPLDELQIEPDIIKIDTEGWDYEVISGLRETIRRTRPYLLVEYSPQLMERLPEFCREGHYTVYLYDLEKDCFLIFDSQREQAVCRQAVIQNIFLVPEEKIKLIPTSTLD